MNTDHSHRIATKIRNICFAGRSRSTAAMLLATIASSSTPLASAQTSVTISSPPARTFAAAGAISKSLYPGYTNALVKFTLTGGTDPIDLFVTGAPAGVLAGFSTNSPTGTTNILPMLQVTSTTSAYFAVVVTNAPKGVYPLTIVASNEVSGLTVTTNTLLILPAVFVAGSAGTNWSTATNWSIGSTPASGDGVKFEFQTTNTCLFDTSVTLDSLAFLPQSSGYAYTNVFGSNVTVAVSGPNGFLAGVDNFVGASEKAVSVVMTGASGSLVVTNPTASFSMWDLAGSGGTKSAFNFSALGNLYVDVSRFGGGDSSLMAPNVLGVGGSAGQVVDIFFARTNFIRATTVGDYSGYGTMTNSIMFFNNAGVNNGSGSTAQLGISNVFYADSITVASHCAGSGSPNNALKFNAAFTSQNPVAIFRGANGGRMPFFGVGIDSGTNAASPRTRGVADFTGGKVDMLVDTMWLGHNRTNFSGANQQIGNLTFTIGKVDVNTLRAGYKQYATTNYVQSTVTVGGATSNATLAVNNLLELGYTAPATLVAGDGTPQSYGRLNINSGGVVLANTIKVGALSTNNQIVISGGGQLVVTNTIAGPDVALTTLNVNNGQLTFFVTAGATPAYVTNLTIGANGGKVNIASLTGFPTNEPATQAIISYQDSAASHNLTIGTLPKGFNNITLADNTANKTIELRIATNAPATLRWLGRENATWDHNSLNWQNTNTLAITRFFDGDSVIFDDTVGVPTTITIADAILPGQVSTGILVTSSINAFTFIDGGGSIANCAMLKSGTSKLTFSASASATVQLNGGTLAGAGTLGSITVSTNTVLDFSGTINGPLVVSGGGTATIAGSGIVANSLSISSWGVLTNSGTIQGGSLSVSTNGLLVNDITGGLVNIGSATISGTLLNLGTVGSDGQANNITVNGTFKDMGIGDIFLTTLTFNSGSTFIPGGDGIGKTEVKSCGVGSTYPGRLTLLTGSTTLVKVDFANPQTNTLVVAQFTDFGANSSTKAYDGGTVLITNVNSAYADFALGQSFRVFTGPSGSNIGNEGFNTTNRYPIVKPAIPAPNTKWDLTFLRDTSPNGFLNIVSFPTTSTNLTMTTLISGEDVVTHLSWPSDYIGWSLQQQTNTLAVGIYTNWTTVSGSSATNEIYITNSVAIPASFFRMVYP